jgi:hypothetical protein
MVSGIDAHTERFALAKYSEVSQAGRYNEVDMWFPLPVSTLVTMACQSSRFSIGEVVLWLPILWYVSCQVAEEASCDGAWVRGDSYRHSDTGICRPEVWLHASTYSSVACRDHL